MVASLYVCLLAQANVPITAELRTVTLAAAVAELEKLTGVPHKLAGANPDQFIYINVKGLVASRVREGIARVARGEWKVIEGAQVLITEPWSKALDEVYARRVADEQRITKIPKEKPVAIALITDYIKRVEGASSSSQANEAYWEWIEGTPAARLIKDLVSILPLQELTQLKFKERKVFSLSPTELQAKLPTSAGPLFSQFLSENRQFAIVATTHSGLTQHSNMFNQNSGFVDPAIHGEPHHLLLTVIRQNEGVDINLRLFNEKGEIVLDQDHFKVLDFPGRMNARKGDIFSLVSPNEPVKLNPKESAFNEKFLHAVRAQREKPGLVLQPDVMVSERLEKLVQNDILLNGPTEVLDQFSSLIKKDLIAKMTDSNFSALVFFSHRRDFTLPSLLQAVYNPFSDDEDEFLQAENDLVTLRPHPNYADYCKGYFNRSAVAELVRQARKGRIGYAENAVMCAAHETYDDTILPQRLRGIFSSASGYLFNEADYVLLRFFGLLAQDTRDKAAKSEISIPWQSLVGPQLYQARRLVLWSGQSLNGREGLNSEVTQGLAGANLTQAVVKVSLTKTPLWFMKSESLRTTLQAASPETVSGLLSPALIKAGKGIENYDFLRGAVEVLQVTFDFGQFGTVSHQLDRLELLHNGKGLKYSELPDDFKKAVQNAVMRPEGGG